jgi:hypothetical protein
MDIATVVEEISLVGVHAVATVAVMTDMMATR